jgi:drug/metabolite transporter (DMT)-like permease
VTSSSHVRPRRWPTVAVAWLIAFVAFTVLALAFDVNGAPYGGWARTFGILSFATIPAAVAAGVFRPHVTRQRLGVVIAGVAIAAAALAVTAWQYGDAQSAATWPRALAWIGLAALLGSGAALAVPAPHSDRSIR